MEDVAREGGLGRRFARNVSWNFLGQVWVVVLSFFSAPYIAKTLGASLYGLLNTISNFISFVLIFSSGVTIFSSKYLSEEAAVKDWEAFRRTFWASWLAYAIVGLVLALVLMGIAVGGPERWFQIPPSIEGQVGVLFGLSALQFWLSMLAGAPVAVLRALQRFGLENRVSIGINTLQILLSIIVLLLGFSLYEMVWVNLVMAGFSLLLYSYLGYKLCPVIGEAVFDKGAFLRLMRFGGWVSFSSFLASLLVNLDKLLLPTRVTSAQVAYYSVPYNLIMRLTIIPGAFSAVLLPLFSSLGGTGRQETSVDLNQRVNRFILLVFLPIICFFFLFSYDFLNTWMGAEYAREGALVLRIFSVAIFINVLVWSPLNLLLSVGKVRLIAKFYLVEILLFVPLLWILVRVSPLPGAAFAWLCRVLLDSILIHVAAARLFKISQKAWLIEVMRPALIMVGVGLLLRIVWRYIPVEWVSLWSLFLWAGLYGIVALGILWRWGLRLDERRLAIRMLRELRA